MADGFDTIEDSLTRSRTIIDALRAEVEEKTREVAIAVDEVETVNKQVKALQEDNNALKDMLRKYTEPLTDEQYLAVLKRLDDPAYTLEKLLRGDVDALDAAIRAAREGAGK